MKRVVVVLLAVLPVVCGVSYWLGYGNVAFYAGFLWFCVVSWTARVVGMENELYVERAARGRRKDEERLL
ncbi:hypothetical protein [Brevibacillus dissolubilis]|uniref:hypothetical protein n=1 Tax=Brevibacillus dissolubilis TaxID=1844116 RepID=UPI00111774D9|nr:hypothetical protein [Brevibacillus dissolubilis]